ncbi:TPA: hypothetical protein QHX92_000991 [Klebsiella pneumoniae subsp. pneumoniae]|uniref:hypothetical protein n=1 Tax=Klebsiella pneumoniae TaxID=573 RepID=UPI000DD45538|nr:hypothetical protein [Klebsiella pneumoniae]HDS4464678.1 hypothetical protein [Klebsiella pneumoniae subsp. pneumoniae]HDS8679205.1 hypothetical protein [Klebsiella pneumoniae subsp. pneumoniae]HDS8724096.1 hypothetical protein [Klebsiella pneumoniae subsp. pneumoniae]HDU5794975.1 hypothetical protein [Klebsiella pneumoniae subsp. pneumoniae]HEP0897088.1 hypothetical protein [Klebsiella pneumoniae subsp. pneumoniae]
MNIETVNELIQSLESAGELSIGEQKFLKLAKAHVQLAAENVALKKSAPAPFSKLMMEALDTYHSKADDVPELAMLSAYVKLRDGLKTPATDRIVAGIKADGVEMFVRRLQQCVDEGDFVGDEVAVIVGAIDCGKEFCEQLREGAK